MKKALYINRWVAPEEVDIASKYIPTVTSRMLLPRDSIVIPRYGLLPHYKEWVFDLEQINSKLINSHAQHLWVADLREWAMEGGELFGLTPKTYTSRWDKLPEGSYVIKGCTNSMKQEWNTKMFARRKEDVTKIISLLSGDSMIKNQDIVVREYIPLKKLDEGINDLPITNEWRTFWIVADQKPIMLSKGFYWQASHPESEELAEWNDDALLLATKAAERIADRVNFFSIDLAQKEDGGWIIIEINDGGMSGLCGCDPDQFYKNLSNLF